jgi:hypothetical protein
MRTASLWELLPPAEKRGLDLKASALTHEDATAEIYQFSEAVRKELALDEAKLVGRFEQALDTRAAQSRGPIVDELLIRSYFGADFYSGLYETARFLHDQFGSAQAASDFAASLGQPQSSVAQELKRWIEDRSDVYTAKKPPALLVSDIRDLRSIGLAPIFRMRRSADEYLSAQLVERRRMARVLFARMDSRPAFLGEATRIAYGDVHDPRLRDRFLAAAVVSAPRASSDLLDWYAKLGHSTQALKEIGERQDLTPETRSKVLRLLLLADAGERDYAEPRFRDLVTRYPDRSSLADDYAWFEENRRGAEAGSRVLKEWLQTNSGKQDLGWVHVATSLSKSLQGQGKLQEAWEVIAPVVDSGKGETLAQAAEVLEALGKHAQAREMAQDNLGRYPTSAYAVANYASLLWRQHDDAGAAELLQHNDKYLTRGDWSGAVAVDFAKAFAKSSPEDAERAFDKIAAHALEPEKVSSLVGALAGKGRHDIALALSQKTPPPARQTIYDWLRTYREMKQVRGAADATEWLKQRISPAAAEGASTAFYYEREYDLLWDLITSLPNRTKNNMLQLFRAAALLRMRASESDPRWRQLLSDFGEPGPPDRFIDFGRYLVGLDSEQKLVDSVKGAQGICDVGYLIGVKKVSQRKYDEAMDWFQVALESGDAATPLYNSTYAYISGWARAEKSFAQIAAEGL